MAWSVECAVLEGVDEISEAAVPLTGHERGHPAAGAHAVVDLVKVCLFVDGGYSLQREKRERESMREI